MEEMKFISPTNGQMTKNEIYQFLLDKIKDLEALIARLEQEKETKEQENHDILY